ncbi:Protein ABSCISIC ACID-INSENSITIVE 5 [Glycine soja]
MKFVETKFVAYGRLFQELAPLSTHMSLQQPNQEVPLQELETTFSQLSKQNLILSLTLDEFYCKNGKSLRSMNMDDFLSSIWNSDDNNQVNSPLPTLDEAAKGLLMQSYPPRVLDRRLQEAWARATKEGPRVLMNLRLSFSFFRNLLKEASQGGELSYERGISFFHGLFPSGWRLLSPLLLCLPLHLHGGKSPLKDLIEAQRSSLHRSPTSKLPSSGNQSTRASSRKNHNLGTNMSHHSSSVNGEGTSHKDPLSRILDELSSLKLWKEKQERKEKGKKRVKEISQDERKKIREEERRKIMKEMKREKYASYSSHNSCKSLSEELHDYYEGRHRSHLRPHSHRREKERKPQEANINLPYFHGKDNVEANLVWEIRVEQQLKKKSTPKSYGSHSYPKKDQGQGILG